MKKQIHGAFVIFDSEKNFYASREKEGVAKKVNNQIQTFCNSGLCIDVVFVDWRLYGRSYFKLNYWLKATTCIPFINPYLSFNKESQWYDFVYMRRAPYCNAFVLNMLRKIQTNKLIMEIPTYPYDGELNNIGHYIVLLKDRIHRRYLHKYVDRIATLTDDREIFGVPTIKIKNGYDFDSFATRIPIKKQGIDLCCVAMFSFWHGYERLIQGLYNYLQKTDNGRLIKIHFAGEGAELEKYKKQVASLGLEKYVHFYGRLDSKALRELYNSVDIGMNSLGIYKTGGTVGMQLKTREYLAVGLPIVTGVHLDLHDYEEIVPYILEFPNDSSPIDMQKIINFYDRLKLSSVDEATRIANYLHDTGEKYLGMDAAMRNVIDYIVGR